MTKGKLFKIAPLWLMLALVLLLVLLQVLQPYMLLVGKLVE